MGKRLYTEADIRSLVKDQQKVLTLHKGDIITPLARDAARDSGLQIVEGEVNSPHASNQDGLESRVRQILERLMGQPVQRQVQGSFPVTHIAGQSLKLSPFPFEINRPGMDVRCEDVITGSNGSPMAAGFLTMHTGSFPWTLHYDEIEYVIEGELHIGTNHGTIVGKPGDVIFVPKGTSITFGTPSWAKFLYVTYPANWSGTNLPDNR